MFADLCQMVSLLHTVGQRAKSFSFLRNNFYCLFTGTRNFPHGQDKEILSPDLGISQVPTLGSQTQPSGAHCAVGSILGLVWGGRRDAVGMVPAELSGQAPSRAVAPAVLGVITSAHTRSRCMDQHDSWKETLFHLNSYFSLFTCPE